MEYKRIHLPLKYDFFPTLKCVSPGNYDTTKEVDEEISKHLKNGWRIVSTTPITGSRAMDEKGLSFMNAENVYTYTIAIEVFLVKE